MRFYLLYERCNNSSFEHLKGAYFKKRDAKATSKNPPKSSHAELIDGKYKMIPDTYTYKVKKVRLKNPTFDVCVNYVTRSGNRISGLKYKEACALYDKYSKNNWVQLQIPLKQFDSSGVTKIKSNENEQYRKERDAYWDAKAEEEEENEFYSPSTPWGAPGMSKKDFI